MPDAQVFDFLCTWMKNHRANRITVLHISLLTYFLYRNIRSIQVNCILFLSVWISSEFINLFLIDIINTIYRIRRLRVSPDDGPDVKE